MAELVKLCPTCGAHNAATAARCVCGAFLIGVDLVDVWSEPAEAAVMPPPDAASAVVETTTLDAGHGAVCRFSDCGQTNPPGAAVCVYCNRPLEASPEGGEAAATSEASAPERPVPSASAPRRSLIRLPATLEARFEIEKPLKAAGGEADLFIVRERSSRSRTVLKLYRFGIEPRTDVLERATRAAPDQLVRLIEHGRADDVPYELLEYCEHGSLRMLLKGRALPPEAARTLLSELADAIEHLHQCGIVHRDLKPENVLIRGLLPLDLVLTDFGTASVSDATMHYTTAARTLRYAAPEVGSNWVGRPSDYWALGMILTEALTGRHPFDGLSEPVIAHWLVTRAIDVSGIEDARWRVLCRGLLTRDPKLRWGAPEIRRWLAGDPTLVAAEESSGPNASAVSPYRVADRECRTPRELAVALAANWSTGVKDLKRGMLRAWLQNELRDQNLARAAADAEEALEMSDDERLLRFLLRLDPELPPVFKGYDVSIPGLAALTRKALEDRNEAHQLVCEMLDRRLLGVFPGNPLQAAQEQFEVASSEFEQTLARGLEAGAPRTLIPDSREWQLRMLLFVLEPAADLAQSLSAQARRTGARAAQRAPWYRALGDIDTATPAALAAMVLLGPAAAQAGMESERDAARRALTALAVTIDSCPELIAQHGSARERLASSIESSHDEEEVLGFSQAVASLGQAVEATLLALLRGQVFESRTIEDPSRVRQLRSRIGEWAAWRSGEAWQGFGERIEIADVRERRSYRTEVASQVEIRRVAYKYSTVDIARMPAQARATLDDVWSCAMPALPQFAADFNLARPSALHCPRCGVSGRAELQESWGSMVYPFSTTFACNDKVGVQCQTRIERASRVFPVCGVPAFVADFIATHAMEAASTERTLVVEAPSLPSRWLDAMPDGELRAWCRETLQSAGAELKALERVTEQRLTITWSGMVEVHYRFGGKDYRIWVPNREDAPPIALEHPLAELPTAPAAPAQASVAQRDDERLDRAVEASARVPSNMQPVASAASARGDIGWIRSLGIWLAIFVVLGCVAAWIVNWRP